jgi:hypothetical protein
MTIDGKRTSTTTAATRFNRRFTGITFGFCAVVELGALLMS